MLSRRQQLIPEGFNSMIHSLHAGGKFRPFVAMMVMGWLAEDRTLKFEWYVLFC
jgi:hypothetical protein